MTYASEKQPLVSIIIPVYNAQSYLRDTIDCISRQTYRSYEFLFVDDGSNDNTINIIEKARETNNKIKLFHRERLPKGAPTCRNIGLDNSQGKYVIFIDADDLFSDTFLEKRVMYMEKNSNCDYAIFRGSNYVMTKDNKHYIGGKTWGEAISRDILSDFLSTNYPFSIWNNIYVKEKIKKIYWDEKISVYQDFDYALSIIFEKLHFNFVMNQDFDYFYRRGISNTISSDFISDSKFHSTLYLFDKTWNSISDIQNSEKYKNDFTNFFILQFSRIMIDGSSQQKVSFLEFCNNKLSKGTIKKMKSVEKICSKLNNKKAVKLIIYTFYYPNMLLKYVVKFNK
ncbi:glycosyltransferase family 2 protein [Desemzia sp. FAM 24101]|uniref:glycosyltransferase family 2 protein n=1 Tax=Desemzia sp. FAM 24101 TaxID=3259522 RepID=UPI003888ACD4